MGRRAFAVVTVLVASAAGGAACESTLNLGNPGSEADAAAPDADAAPPTCVSTCDRLIDTCGLVARDKRDACLAECYQKGSAADLSCAARTPCASIPTVCGDGTIGDGAAPAFDSSALEEFEITTCRSACDSAQFFSCIDASEHTTCRELCATAPRAKRGAYEACQHGAGGNCMKASACFAEFTKD